MGNSRMWLVAVLAAACSSKRALPSHRVETLQFKGASLAVPAGWNQVDEPKLIKDAGPNGFVLTPIVLAPGFTPTVLIQQLELPQDATAAMHAMTAERCTNDIQKPMAAATKTNPGASKVWESGGFHGCDVEVISPDSAQSTRQISLTNGTFTISIVCNRDKAGVPAVDAACEAMAKAVTAK